MRKLLQKLSFGLCVALPLAAGASPASAASLRPLVSVGEQPMSDGGRWAILDDRYGKLEVFDAQSRSLNEVDIANACGPGVSGDAKGTSGGYVSLECSGAPDGTNAVIYDLQAKTVLPIANAQALQSTSFEGRGYERTSIGSAGSQWLQVSFSAHDGSSVSPLLNWRDGRVVTPQLRANQIIDLNAATGTKTLCEGLRRGRSLIGFSSPYAATVHSDGGGRRLLLRRCGSRPLTVARSFADARLGSQALAWSSSDGQTVTARRLSTGKTSRWQVPQGPGTGTGSIVIPYVLGRSLLVYVSPLAGPSEVYTAVLK